MAALRPVPALSLGARATVELFERHGLRSDKRLGQHFLIDPNQVDRIVTIAEIADGDHVIEVGPGVGALTRGLLEAGAEVVAVEIDVDLVRVLREELPQTGLQIVHQDALEVDWVTTADPTHNWKMVANLPYNVATPLVLDVLDEVPQITSLLVMVQREVAERLVAEPGTAAYGAPSVKVAWWARGRIAARIPPTVFLPQPRVESALVLLDRYSAPHQTTPVDEVFELVHTAFRQRRKMLRRSLAAQLAVADFEAAGVDPSARPETLGVEAWHALHLARSQRPGS